MHLLNHVNSVKRKFALTRGTLNNYIEDARKGIEDHQSDLQNSITLKHQGDFSSDNNQSVTYDFSNAHLSPQRKRDILLAISFIEGCDNLVTQDNSDFIVSNEMQANKPKEKLDVISATAWKTHRDIKTTLKSVGHYIKNSIASLFVATRPWEEESWRNKQFHLFAKTLRNKIEPNPAMWQKLWGTLRLFSDLARDFIQGITDFGTELVINMPEELINDYQAATSLPPLPTIIDEANQDIEQIKEIEKNNLLEVFTRCDYKKQACSKPASELALVEYRLNSGEQNDILSAITRGVYGVSSVISHDIYTKNPVGGLVFTSAYALGAGAIYLPSLVSSITGPGYTKWATNFAYTMSSSQFGAAIAGGSMQAQVASLALDAATSGPRSKLMNTAYQIGEDPLTYGAYFACAYGLGYVLTNGVNGYKIPWVSEYFQDELGTIPSTYYPFLGGKIALMFYEAFAKDGKILLADLPQLDLKRDRDVKKIQLLSWMLQNKKELPKFSSKLRFDLARLLDIYFEKQQSRSLKTLLDKPKSYYSVARQTVFIPLSYLASLLRVVTSLVISVSLFIYSVAGKEKTAIDKPWKPFIRAGKALLEKSWQDITRLYFFGKYIKDSTMALLTAMVKQIIYPIVMLLGRVLAIFGKKSAHFIYNAFSKLHNFQRRIEERFYPTHLLSAREAAEPAHTVRQIHSSYKVVIDGTDKPDMVLGQQSANGKERFSNHSASVTQPLFCGQSNGPSHSQTESQQGVNLNPHS